jgi:catechol 2,3-dioxygenase-like lactoylglutathione lyase family enzyme
MKIKLTSVFVDDQAKALEFYTRVLGFVKKTDFPAGKFRWLTIVSPEEPNGLNWFLSLTRIPRPDHTKNPFSSREFAQPCSSSTIFRKSTRD